VRPINARELKKADREADLVFISGFLCGFKIAGVPSKDAGKLIAFGVVVPLNPGRFQAAIAAILMTFRPTVKTSYEKCGTAENDDGDPVLAIGRDVALRRPRWEVGSEDRGMEE
jgi:hypothetical protein